MKITDSTTFAELALEKGRLGITHLLISERPRPKKPITIEHLVDIYLVTEDGKAIQKTGGSIPETLNQAFEAREAQIAAMILLDREGK